MLAPTELPQPAQLNPLIARLERQLRDYLYITDFEPTLASLGVAVSQGLEVDPLWLMLVQSSGSGKTENIRLTHGVADARLKNFSRAGLLTYEKIKGIPFPKGILAELEGVPHAYLTITDFSALLEMRQGGGAEISDLFNAMRDVYDGEYRRDIGGVSLHWAGRITLLAACTPAIDNFSAHADALGTRWVYFRIPEHSLEVKKRIAQMAEDRESIDDFRAAAQATATEIITAARARVNHVRLPGEFSTVIQHAAILAGYGRANVPRDYRGQVSGMPDAEDPGRLVGQLKTLALSLLAMDLPEDVALRITRRAALSSMPVSMLKMLEVIAHDREGDGGVTAYGAHRLTGIHRRLTGRSLENWELIGIMDAETIGEIELGEDSEKGKRKLYSISPDMRQLVDTGLGVEREEF